MGGQNTGKTITFKKDSECALTVTLMADPKVIEDIQDISITNDPTVVEVIRYVNWTPTKDKTGGSAIFLLSANSNVLPEKLIN
ncbi:hypothetical protein [Xenorhabdus ishibashii]|uniref:Uncharacterized protein n=1 Tax=Xenorhabdus ishibashii TaxID=1034471 RepID=A0A2D0KKC5_9GAMM|nr:hypothetical protein [Xenorhabdus ishibashii]PHM63842.1 hypothetical protein Xish_03118 [Xenorhabdus ishibashii]